MKFLILTVIRGLAMLILCASACAITPSPSTNRYEAIPDRNVFGLKPSTSMPQQPPQKNPPQIILTGITTLLGNKLALLQALLPAPPGLPPREQRLALTEGQREGNIEVLEVDEKAGRVKVDDFGTITNLTFERNGPKLPSAPPSAPALASPGPLVPTLGSTTAPPVTSYVAPPNLTAGMSAMPSRALRSTPAGGPSSPPPISTAPAQTQPQQQLTPEEQAFLLELEQQTAAPQPPQPLPPALYSTNAAIPVPVLPGVLPPGANTQRATPPLMPQ